MHLDGLGPAVFATLFAYNGWQNVGQMAEEMRDPQRELPRAIVIAMICVTTTYLALNVAYLCVLPAFGPPVRLLSFDSIVSVA